FSQLAAHLDTIFEKGANADALRGVSIEEEKSRVSAEYLKRMGDKGEGAVGMLKEIATLVPKFENIALGDADLYIKIEKSLVETRYDDDDNEKEVTLVEGKG